MDPNETLRQLRRRVQAVQKIEKEATEVGDLPEHREKLLEIAQEMSELFDALDGWCVHGGFLPDAWQAGR